MDKNEFLANFAEQFEDTDPNEIQFDTKYHELDEWSSLTGLLVIGMVLDKYGKNLKADEVRNGVTIEDLYNVVNSL